MKKYSAFIFILFLIACRGKQDRKELDHFFDSQLVEWNKKLTQVVITDVLTPPVCSRVYAYTNVAAYEAFTAADSSYKSYAGKLNGLEKPPPPSGNRDQYYFPLSSIIAFTTVAQKVVFNAEAIGDMEAEFIAGLDKYGIDEEVMQQSIDYGRIVGQHIIDWASKDGYLQRNALPGYIVTRESGRWEPTPPDYMDAIEPNWHSLRPFVLDSASQFRPAKPEVFDSVVNSGYYKSALNVYQVLDSTDPEKVAIAKFWDCNPNISVTQGHVMYFQQKISPAGHWMSIGAMACRKKEYTAIQTAEVLSKLAVTIADGFINCWEAKFHYNTIRPETVINRYINKDWRPILQTPPFPEYPSGHSVISGASATLLTNIFGDGFAYIDSTEVPFGLPPRSFKSFNDAAFEASMSRLYGGIHFLPSLTNGLEEGKQISLFVMNKLKDENQPK